jgi:hypothetical protein
MPARKKPVKNLSTSRLVNPFQSVMAARLNMDPARALIKKTLDGEKRSAMVRRAKRSVPMINPN